MISGYSIPGAVSLSLFPKLKHLPYFYSCFCLCYLLLFSLLPCAMFACPNLTQQICHQKRELMSCLPFTNSFLLLFLLLFFSPSLFFSETTCYTLSTSYTPWPKMSNFVLSCWKTLSVIGPALARCNVVVRTDHLANLRVTQGLH